MTVAVMAHPSVDERRTKGRAAREGRLFRGTADGRRRVAARIRWRYWRPRT